RKIAQEMLAIQKKAGPDGHWRVASARRLIDYIERLAALDPVKRMRLSEAEQQSVQAEQLANSGKCKEGAPRAERVVQIRLEILGANDPEYLTALSNLGWMYREQESYGKAEPILREALTKRQRVLGEDHPHFALSNNVLGWLHIGRKQYKDAEALFRR